MAQCTATSKQSGNRCRREATPGWNVCHSHGSGTPRGVDSPQFKHGRYSKDLPTRVLGRYEEARKDPDLLSAIDDIALIDARIADLLARVEGGESGELWAALHKAAQDVRAAPRKKGAEGAAAFRTATIVVLELIEQGHADRVAWNDITRLIEKRDRIVSAERRRMVEAQQTISTRQAVAFAGALLDSVVRNVDDAHALAAIRDDFARILGQDGSRSADAGI